MEPNTKLSISPTAISKELGDETVLLELDSGSYFGLDAIGTRIWKLINDGKNLNEICDTLLDEYEVSRKDCWDPRADSRPLDSSACGPP